VGILEDVYNAVINGKVDDAAAGVEQGLNSGIAVDELLKKGLLSAMDLVGERFGEGDIFIPQVIWSAKAMQAGMDLLRPHFVEGQLEKSARIIIGTAQGDIHDIGKNLVAMMLEGAGFERAVAQIEFYLLTPAHLVRLISGFFSSRFLQTHK